MIDFVTIISKLKNIKSLNIPNHEIIEINRETLKNIEKEEEVLFWEKYKKIILETIKKFTYPIFVRTENYSASKYWESSCFINSDEKIKDNIMRILKKSIQKNINFNYLIISETIPFLSTKIKNKIRISHEYIFYKNQNEISYDIRWKDEEITELKPQEYEELCNIVKEIYSINDLDNYKYIFSKDIKGKFWLIKIFLNN